VARRVGVKPIERGSLRIDFGEIITLDKQVVRPGSIPSRWARFRRTTILPSL